MHVADGLLLLRVFTQTARFSPRQLLPLLLLLSRNRTLGDLPNEGGLNTIFSLRLAVSESLT